MNLPLPHARLLQRLGRGEVLPHSALPQALREQLLADELIGYHALKGSRKTLWMPNPHLLEAYLKNQYQLTDLALYIAAMESESATRAELVKQSGDSKAKRVRSFTGFAVNVVAPMECRLYGQPLTIAPTTGAFTFVHGYNGFEIPHGATVVGIENPANFTDLPSLTKLFGHLDALFVCRYPQSHDLRRWLAAIPNTYVHFGDFDFAGLNIYQHEIYCHIPSRATFYVPNGLDELFERYGNPDRYHTQQLHEATATNPQPEVQQLVALISKHKKGLDQEVFGSVGS